HTPTANTLSPPPPTAPSLAHFTPASPRPPSSTHPRPASPQPTAFPTSAPQTLFAPAAAVSSPEPRHSTHLATFSAPHPTRLVPPVYHNRPTALRWAHSGLSAPHPRYPVLTCTRSRCGPPLELPSTGAARPPSTAPSRHPPAGSSRPVRAHLPFLRPARSSTPSTRKLHAPPWPLLPDYRQLASTPHPTKSLVPPTTAKPLQHPPYPLASVVPSLLVPTGFPIHHPSSPPPTVAPPPQSSPQCPEHTLRTYPRLVFYTAPTPCHYAATGHFPPLPAPPPRPLPDPAHPHQPHAPPATTLGHTAPSPPKRRTSPSRHPRPDSPPLPALAVSYLPHPALTPPDNFAHTTVSTPSALLLPGSSLPLHFVSNLLT
ncbi:vegetative cell wall protein gp1-like, partial [Homalodisca vitripennis]|uniref:vegetative cell wall protein gp1-like n=1 Tax=Homalodisca vitripennis TaxID=197043 RepID=UPI001EEBECCF